MTIRDAVEQAEKILGQQKIPLMADAWVALRDEIASAIHNAYLAGVGHVADGGA